MKASEGYRADVGATRQTDVDRIIVLCIIHTSTQHRAQATGDAISLSSPSMAGLRMCSSYCASRQLLHARSLTILSLAALDILPALLGSRGRERRPKDQQERQRHGPRERSEHAADVFTPALQRATADGAQGQREGSRRHRLCEEAKHGILPLLALGERVQLRLLRRGGDVLSGKAIRLDLAGRSAPSKVCAHRGLGDQRRGSENVADAHGRRLYKGR
jgi:hypothetical protein